MKQKLGIIFDCDGTLVDSLGQAMESFNYALNSIGEPANDPQTIKQYFGRAADRIFLAILKDKERAQAAFEIYMNHQSELAQKTKLHLGVRSLLDRLKLSDVPMAVVTGRHERDLEVVLRPHSLHDYFQVLIADNQLPNSKPAPDGILLAASRLELDPQNCFYVGDSVVDIRAARAANSIAVAALWDPLARESEMSEQKPDFIAREPSEVWDISERVRTRN